MENFKTIRYVWGQKRVIEGTLNENAQVLQALREASVHLKWVGTFQEFHVIGPVQLVGKSQKFVIEQGETVEQVLKNFDAQIRSSAENLPKQTPAASFEK